MNLPPLPEDASKRLRASMMLIQFLIYHNRIDGLMAFVGVWWGGLTIALPHFWYSWPVTDRLTMMMFGVPGLVSWLLLFSGLLSYAAKRWHWLRVQFICSLVAFICWSLLTVAFATVRPIFSPAVACYSSFAIAKLMLFLSQGIGLEERGYAHGPERRFQGH